MNIELLKTFKILYVEDEKSLRDEVYQNLQAFVKDVIIAEDGEMGLNLYLENRSTIDLIVSDILMPKMNGIEMIDEIRKVDSKIPVIYTTAFNDTEYMKKTIEQGVVSYIVKPIDIEILLEAIEKASIKIEDERLQQSLSLELAEKKEDLHLQLYKDELTSLFNRKALLKDLKQLKNPILSIVDIDAFKSINDVYGESVGNDVLIHISKILFEFSKANNCKVYRIGSDEFVLLRNEAFDIEKCKKIISEIIETINENIVYLENSNISLRIDVTVGISTEKKETLETANMALKIAKRDKFSYLFYKDEFNFDKEYQNDLKWIKKIEKAIKSDNVVIFFQPIIDAHQNIIKYEALVRIKEDENIYSPYLFLDIAKKAKFYNQITRIVISKALKKANEMQTNISVNLSVEDIFNPSTLDFIKQEILKYDVAKYIIFEILESENITDYEKVISFIESVKALGCKIAIDDFGSGYSNFVYLLKLKPDYLKIDGSLVKSMDSDMNSRLITKTINDFAHSLGMKTIAEFVHSKEIFDIAKEMEIDEFQGYYFSEPLEEISCAVFE